MIAMLERVFERCMYYGLPEDVLARLAKETEIEERMNSNGELEVNYGADISMLTRMIGVGKI